MGSICGVQQLEVKKRNHRIEMDFSEHVQQYFIPSINGNGNAKYFRQNNR